MKFKALLLLLFVFTFAQATPPPLSPGDVTDRVREIMSAHARHKTLSEEVMRRTLVNYVELLDPAKTYFTAQEVNSWVHPSDEVIAKTLADFRAQDFLLFQQIHESLLQAIERRNLLDPHIASAELPKDIDPKEFKDLDWASDEEALKSRLVRLRALQTGAAEKLGEAEAELTMQRLAKWRRHREEDMSAESPEEQQQVVLSYVLKASAAALDSQTAYLTPEEASDFLIQMQQRLFGIGVQLRDDLDGFRILRVIEPGPAAREGTLRPNDRIVAVAGEPVIGEPITDVVKQIRGPEGTSVTLTVLRDDERLDVTIERGEVVLEEARFDSSYEPFADGIVGRVSLYTFYQDQNHSSASDLRQAIQELKDQHNLKGLILDLRQNQGGLLPQAIEVAGLFITKGIVASVRDEEGKIHHLRETNPEVAWDGPLVVLVSRASASASEIVAQSLQDYGRAIIVGDPVTFGKGTFQTTTLDALRSDLIDPKGEHKVTRGTYYTVSGKSPQLVGVASDIPVPGIYSEMEIGEQFSKFPLENDQIEAHFDDDLSDIPVMQRIYARQTYLFGLQEQLTTYNGLIEPLQVNSTYRLENNLDYQNFLRQMKEESVGEQTPFGSNDHQLIEATNIMKDLIYLLEAA